MLPNRIVLIVVLLVYHTRTTSPLWRPHYDRYPLTITDRVQFYCFSYVIQKYALSVILISLCVYHTNVPGYPNHLCNPVTVQAWWSQKLESRRDPWRQHDVVEVMCVFAALSQHSPWILRHHWWRSISDWRRRVKTTRMCSLVNISAIRFTDAHCSILTRYFSTMPRIEYKNVLWHFHSTLFLMLCIALRLPILSRNMISMWRTSCISCWFLTTVGVTWDSAIIQTLLSKVHSQVVCKVTKSRAVHLR